VVGLLVVADRPVTAGLPAMLELPVIRVLHLSLRGRSG
jgi:hypothetical protein